MKHIVVYCSASDLWWTSACTERDTTWNEMKAQIWTSKWNSRKSIAFDAPIRILAHRGNWKHLSNSGLGDIFQFPSAVIFRLHMQMIHEHISGKSARQSFMLRKELPILESTLGHDNKQIRCPAKWWGSSLTYVQLAEASSSKTSRLTDH